MTEVNTIFSTSIAPNAQQTTPLAAQMPSERTIGLASDFETFLKMLTAQARHQDPLEPIDSTEYAAQLAQFSMVEQQVKTNDSLSGLLELMGTSNMASLAGWVGMEARADTPIRFDGTPITVSTNPAPIADQAILVVTNGNGAEVQRMPIDISASTIVWAGVDPGGQPVENEVYQFSVESFVAGEKILTERAEVYSQIKEAQIRNGNVTLILQGDHEISSASVTALRAGT